MKTAIQRYITGASALGQVALYAMLALTTVTMVRAF
jgi:hypothetical protein